MDDEGNITKVCNVAVYKMRNMNKKLVINFQLSMPVNTAQKYLTTFMSFLFVKQTFLRHIFIQG